MQKHKTYNKTINNFIDRNKLRDGINKELLNINNY